MRIDIITIFPEYLAALDQSLLGKAQQRRLVDVRVHDLRQWTDDVHRTVDDTPYGGGPGMVMTPQPWGRALDALYPEPSDRATPEGGGATDISPRADTLSYVDELPSIDTSPGKDMTSALGAPPRLIVPTPAGAPFTQERATRYAAENRLIFACGRYEGIDYRFVEHAAQRMPVDELSIGDYVLAGGESATLVMVEAITRLLPGVVGNEESVADDSFSDGILEGPMYTRPRIWRGHEVPPVLLSGDHGAIAKWRRRQGLIRTAARRPELLDAVRGRLSREDQAVLAEVVAAHHDVSQKSLPDE